MWKIYVLAAFGFIFSGCGKNTVDEKPPATNNSPFDFAKEFVHKNLEKGGTFSDLVCEHTGTSDGTGISIFDGEYEKDGTVKRWRVITNDEQNFVLGGRIGDEIAVNVKDEWLLKNISKILNNSPRILAESYINRKVGKNLKATGVKIAKEKLADKTLVWVVEGEFEDKGRTNVFRVVTNPTFQFVFCSKINDKLEFEIENGQPDSELGKMLRR